MKRTDFQFFVTERNIKETEKGFTYILVLKAGGGHKLTFKGDSSELFEGYPRGLAVGVKLYNPQTTLAQVKEGEPMKEEESEDIEEEEKDINEEDE